MNWEQMDGLERCRQFKRLRKLFFEALGDYWSKNFAEYETVFKYPPAQETNRSMSSMQIIPEGEWSLICALRGGKTNGR